MDYKNYKTYAWYKTYKEKRFESAIKIKRSESALHKGIKTLPVEDKPGLLDRFQILN